MIAGDIQMRTGQRNHHFVSLRDIGNITTGNMQGRIEIAAESGTLSGCGRMTALVSGGLRRASATGYYLSALQAD